jgi:hypothetical protein
MRDSLLTLELGVKEERIRIALEKGSTLLREDERRGVHETWAHL